MSITSELDTLYQHQLELLTAAYSQAKAYFNLVIVGGYAAFFALWALVADELSGPQKLWSALSISFSLITFIVWEISQMIVSNLSLLSIAEAVNNPQTFLHRIEEHNRSEGLRVRRLRKYWIAVLAMTVTTALMAAGILLYAFITGLWQHYS